MSQYNYDSSYKVLICILTVGECLQIERVKFEIGIKYIKWMVICEFRFEEFELSLHTILLKDGF